MLAPPQPRRRQRWLLVTAVVAAVVVFSAIFFPVYFTRSHQRSGDEGVSATNDRSITTPGAVWQQKTQFRDLDDFRISYYSSGQNNSKVLSSLPASAYKQQQVRIEMKRPNKALRRQDLTSSSSSTTTTTRTATRTSTTSTRSTPSSTSTTSTATPRATSGSVLSIFYPRNSYTPSELPVGGTQFYAQTPFDLSRATSVTLNYSVFFPASYDFVQGGKLPGLYGGDEGCGGGNTAQSCWSTRMAWRTNGTGELYAYLPQDKQNITALLEVPPYSYVNPDYGM